MGLIGNKQARLGRLLRSVIFCCCLFFSSTAALGGEVCTLRLRQAYPLKDEIKVYLDILDENEGQVQGLSLKELGLTANLGQKSCRIRSFKPFVQTDEGVAYVFLVDVSKSLTEEEFHQMKEAMGIWVEAMTDKDRAAVVTFGESVRVVQDYTSDQTVLRKVIDLLSPKDLKTQLHRGLAKAIELGRRNDPQLPSRRVIITLSDGREDYTGGMVKDEVLAMLAEDRIPIYALGFYRPPLSAEKQRYLDVLGEFARRSGGDYWQMNSTPIAQAYSDVRRRILQSYVVRVACPEQVMDGSVAHLRLNLTQGGKVLSDGINLRLVAAAAGAGAERGSKGKWVISAIIGLFIAGSLVVVFFKYKTAHSNYPVEEVIDQAEPEAEEDKPSLPGIKIKLTPTGKNEGNRVFELKLVDRITLGREKAENDLSFTDQEISREHCEITREGDLVFIRDLASRNGTYVNGVPISGRHRLENGDVIVIGRTELRISFDSQLIY
ncbi:MAG TPA: FHA domain-containing protein [Bacillota bacterium]